MTGIVFLIVLSAATVAAAFFNSAYGFEGGDEIFQSLLWITVLHFLLKVLLLRAGLKNLKNERSRYSFRKGVSSGYYFLIAIFLVRIWVEDPQALLVTYGLIGAGVAIALQDLFKNFAGGIVLFIARPYQVGDRVEINGQLGDIISIGAITTTMMEMGNWVSGDQSTGRISVIPNGFVLNNPVNNYTKSHDFIWDELVLPITYSSDWKKAVKMLNRIAKRSTKLTAQAAEQTMRKMREVYFLHQRDTAPQVYIKMTDNWIELTLRFVTRVRERRMTRNQITTLILKEIEKTEDIILGNETIDIVGLPEINVQNRQ